MAENMSSEQLLGQANSVWKMLDDLSESDPEAYQKLISKTMKEGAEYLKPPEPCFCISTVKLPEIIRYKIYVNVCSWDQVPPPKTDQDPIPVMAGQVQVQEHRDQEQPYAIVDVIFNSSVLQQIEHKKDHRNLLVHLALDYLEETKQLSVSRSYKNLKMKYKGNAADLRKYLKTGNKGPSEGTDFKDPTGAPVDKGPMSRESLLHQLSSIAVSDASQENAGISLFGQESRQARKNLIQEISSPSAESHPKTTVPVSDISVKESDGGRPRQLVVKVELPGISSVADCELEISEVDLQLSVPSLYNLQLEFPEEVHDGKASASFIKSKNRLIVKIPTKRNVQS